MDGVNKRKIWVTLFPLEGAPAFDFFFLLSFLWGLKKTKKQTWICLKPEWSTFQHRSLGMVSPYTVFNVISKVRHVITGELMCSDEPQ